ncbi:hypothetical protein QAD02_005134 [Eretmocerus hayati]|uniref:Uncharacterized protein n=1 Tax=Eretmocerus hayati TaxID=131215 RepID=A0ACC2NUG2_9HYME|nr:hypothetical protein QAD02_005134 [Eretmocerus hayati]
MKFFSESVILITLSGLLINFIDQISGEFIVRKFGAREEGDKPLKHHKPRYHEGFKTGNGVGRILRSELDSRYYITQLILELNNTDGKPINIIDHGGGQGKNWYNYTVTSASGIIMYKIKIYINKFPSIQHHGVREDGDEILEKQKITEDGLTIGNKTWKVFTGRVDPKYYITQLKAEFNATDDMPVFTQDSKGGYRKNWFNFTTNSYTKGNITSSFVVYGKKIS